MSELIIKKKNTALYCHPATSNRCPPCLLQVIKRTTTNQVGSGSLWQGKIQFLGKIRSESLCLNCISGLVGSKYWMHFLNNVYHCQDTALSAKKKCLGLPWACRATLISALALSLPYSFITSFQGHWLQSLAPEASCLSPYTQGVHGWVHRPPLSGLRFTIDYVVN